MMLTIKYFGAIADLTHKKEEQFPFESADHSLRSVKHELEQKYPGIKNIHYSLALNQSVAIQDEMVNENDELALLPPFAGG
jgi:molybdopterin synthase sulfur carrier subunit